MQSDSLEGSYRLVQLYRKKDYFSKKTHFAFPPLTLSISLSVSSFQIKSTFLLKCQSCESMLFACKNLTEFIILSEKLELYHHYSDTVSDRVLCLKWVEQFFVPSRLAVCLFSADIHIQLQLYFPVLPKLNISSAPVMQLVCYSDKRSRCMNLG